MTGQAQIPVIEFSQIEMTYPGPPPVSALRPCSTRIYPGEYVAIMGKSGSGKSTLINIAGLLHRPTAGTYRFDALDTSSLPEVSRTALRGSSVGFVFQAFHLLPYRAACENVELAMLYSGVPRALRRQRAVQTLRLVGLGHRLNALPTTLSGGERQRVAIARALVNRPRLLLCDEPTGNLDTATAQEVLALIDELHASGQTIVMITHDTSVAARAAHVLHLSDGRLSGDLPPDELLPAGLPSGADRKADRPLGRPQRRRGQGLRPTRLDWRDLAGEALAGLVQRPGRSVMTMLGTILGIGAFVAILGLTATAQGQIGRQFSFLSATQVTVADAGPPLGGPVSFPLDASRLVDRIRGVRAAGVFWSVSGNASGLQISAQIQPGAQGVAASAGLGVTAADPGALSAMGAVIGTGRLYDSFAQSRAAPVAVLGELAAQRLGISQLTGYPAVFLNGVPFTVIGIASSFTRDPGQLLSVIIPTTTALKRYGQPANPRASMLITTRLGAAQVVAKQVAVALRPDDPQLFQVSAPASPTLLQGSINGTVNGLFLALAAISLLIGAIGIVNTTLVAVLERTAEIGLRRAVGARPRHIAAQFLAESVTLGTLGGLTGTALAVVLVLAIAIFRHQTAVIPPWIVFPAPLAGSLIGLLAGLYPAARASRIEPAVALER